MFETTWEVAMYDGEEEPVANNKDIGNIDALKQIFGMR